MRKLQFKFPNQIRISGWDFGSSARAMNQAGGKDSLMTYELVPSAQADLEKVSRSTTERKSMSTKTSIKRIALVAVSALGLGVLTAVAPASAAAKTVSALTQGTIPGFRAGATSTIPVTATFATAGSANADTITVAAKVISAPSGSLLLNRATNTPNHAAGANLNIDASGSAWSSGSPTASSTTSDAANPGTGQNDAQVSRVLGIATASATSGSFGVQFKPDVAGTYQILVSANNTTYNTGDPSTVVTITTAGAPASMTIAKYGQVVEGAASGYSAVVTVSLKDSAGNATILAPGEAINVTTSDTTATSLSASTLSSPSSTGLYSINVNPGTITEDGSAVITFTGSGTLPSTLTNNTTVSVINTAALTEQLTLTSSTGYAGTTPTYYTASKSAHGFTLTLGAAPSAATNYAVNVNATGTGAIDYATYVTVAATKTTGTVSVTQALSATGVTAVAVGTSSAGSAVGSPIVINREAAVANKIAIVGATSVLSATGSKNTFTAQVKNQYAVALANIAVSVSVSGRNTVASTALGVTDANGMISYTLTDVGTSGTTDSVVFNASLTTPSGSSVTATTGGNATATITYGTVTVGTVTIKGGNNTTTGVAASTAQWKDIDAGEDGASATTHDVIATVKDANGSLVSGVPVTFTVAGSGVAITSNTATVYTGSAGTATAQVYAWTAGSYVVTATAGGKTGTSTYQFRQSAAGEERVLSASTSGNLVTAKVVDRFGNPVPSVKIWGTITGGYFGTGTLKTDATTDNDGVVSFIVNGGASTVSLTTYDPTSSSATPGSGQTCARKGAVDCNALAADDTAFTASAAGTATVAEEGVGASFDAAGVASVSVDVTTTGSSDAVDAANDAVEAANAATDAANAAAEAADAATAAAQDAQAAVADLAAQVATLISGIKAQITRLTNLVIKIQKKVNA